MSSSSRGTRRAYIGNLRPRPNLSQILYNDLFIPHCLPVKNYSNDGGEYGDGGGIVVAQPKSVKGKTASSVYALVEFADVEYATQVLDGVKFDGRTLRVSKEKTNFGNGGNNRGFGSMGWAGGDGGGGHRRSSNGGQNRQKKYEQSATDRTVHKGNGNPESRVACNVSKGGSSAVNTFVDGVDLTREESINKGVASIISSEFQESSDEITTAIACTAAMTLLSSIDVFGINDEGNDGDERDENITTVSINSLAKRETDTFGMTDRDFQSRCKLPMSELLTEYGEEDPNWKKQQPVSQEQHAQDVESDIDITNEDFQSRRQLPLSDLLAEYGERDVDWKKDQHKQSSDSNTQQKSKHTKRKSHQSADGQQGKGAINTNSMLAHYNKSYIHLELVSFGYKYGAPSHSKRGFSYAHPLPPIDIRDLDRAPGHVAKFNGLSYLVKRSLLNPSTDTEGDVDDNNCNNEDDGTLAEKRPMRRRVNEIADEVIKILVEAIDEGGHGPISPLTMTLSIGSEYGRHRSVVLVEHLAVVLRARLRKNDGQCAHGADTAGRNNGVVKQAVSVGTRHRDVEARHQDEEAFGEDLKREAKKAEKQARRRQIEEEGNGGTDW